MRALRLSDDRRVFGAWRPHFANDPATAPLSESKYDAFPQGVGLLLSGRDGFLGLALCWSRIYGSLALRNGSNLMKHPCEDAVMDRV